MSPPPRSLSFAVSTSLLTASLSLAVGCDENKPTVNPAPEKQPEQEVHTVNPVAEPEQEHTVNPVAEPEPTTANPGPEPDSPEPPPHVNEGPEPEPPAEPTKAPEPKRVNTRPDGM